jgi:hypothetical protein
MKAPGYDIIGDIHGHALPLAALLHKLGYDRQRGVYRHPRRTALFVGDFIDRGPSQRGVIDIVRPMVDSGAALAVMGNHEFNAICYHSSHPQSGTALRRHSRKNFLQHRAFLDEYPLAAAHTTELIAWFRRLPLFLEVDGIRIVHACWHPPSMGVLAPWLTAANQLSPELLLRAAQEHTPQFAAVETLLKGMEMPLPGNHHFDDKDGVPRRRIRTRWWRSDARTYRDFAVVQPQALAQIPALPLPDEVRRHEYPRDAVPVFFGHYWFSGTPARLTPNAACLDYSVARGGRLTAYRWCGEARLDNAHFVAVGHAESERP